MIPRFCRLQLCDRERPFPHYSDSLPKKVRVDTAVLWPSDRDRRPPCAPEVDARGVDIASSSASLTTITFAAGRDRIETPRLANENSLS
jgi:hypothetical protein